MRLIKFSDGAGVSFTAEDNRDASAIVADLAGWYEGADIRQQEVSRLQDGSFPTTLWREKRTLTMSGVFNCADEAETRRAARMLSGVFRSGCAGNGTISVSGGEADELSAFEVRLDGRPKVALDLLACHVNFQLPLAATDPYLYGAEQKTMAYTSAFGAGLEYPLFDDEDTGVTTGFLEFGDAPPSAAVLTNTGNAIAYPRITVEGEFRSGFTVVLNGDIEGEGRVTWRGNVTAQSPATVDFTGSVFQSGFDQSWALTERGWGGIKPGGSASFTLIPISDGTGLATMSLRPTYL